MMESFRSVVPLDLVPEVNVFSYIFENPSIAISGDHTVYIDGLAGIKRTRAQHIARVRRLATALLAPQKSGGVGIERNQRIGILGDNTLEFSVLVHACLYLGIPFALLNSHWTPHELGHALTLSEPSVIFVAPRRLPLALDSVEKAKNAILLPNIYLIEGSNPRDGYLDIDALIEQTKHMRETPVYPVVRDTLAYLLYSSGTSGLPKTVMISHTNIIATLMQFAARDHQAQADFEDPVGTTVSLGVLPPYHTMGLMVNILGIHTRLTTTVMLPVWSVRDALEVIPRYKVQSIFAVPSMVHQLVHSPLLRQKTIEEKTKLFSSVMSLLTGAASLSPELAAETKALMAPLNANSSTGKQASSLVAVRSAYGLSEATLSVFGPSLQPPARLVPGCDISTALVLSAGLEAALVNVEEDSNASKFKIAPKKEGGYCEGELWLRGQTMALGYWRNEEATRKTFNLSIDGLEGSGWMRTGDSFRTDGEGHFYFVSRLKDVMKIRGVQVSPTEIEEIIISHCKPYISDVCVAGVSSSNPDRAREGDTHVPRAWVVLTDDGQSAGAQNIIIRVENAVKERLSRPKWLTGGVEVIDKIPKSPTGKILRRVLQDDFEARKNKVSARL